jgi:hypothetical protein
MRLFFPVPSPLLCQEQGFFHSDMLCEIEFKPRCHPPSLAINAIDRGGASEPRPRQVKEAECVFFLVPPSTTTCHELWKVKWAPPWSVG